MENTWYCVTDNATKLVIAAGRVVDHKAFPFHCISFDRRYYFSLTDGETYTVNRCKPQYEMNVHNFEHLVKLWRDVERIGPNAIFKENSIFELDKEVEQVVYLLNTVPGIRTLGSCSGHYHKGKYAHIDCAFKTIDSVLFVIDLIKDYNLNMVLTTQDILVNDSDSRELFLRIHTTNKGSKAIETIDRFTQSLQDKLQSDICLTHDV